MKLALILAALLLLSTAACAFLVSGNNPNLVGNFITTDDGLQILTTDDGSQLLTAN